MLKGEYVTLRFPGADDVQIFSGWMKDSEVAKYLPFTYPASSKAVECMIKNFRDNDICRMFIIDTEDEIPIGICSLNDIDWVNGSAKIDVILYAKNCWGRGYGYDALKTLTYFAMYDMNMHVIYTQVMEDNERAIKCFKKAGYEVEGVLRNRLYKDGQRKNLVSMSISK